MGFYLLPRRWKKARSSEKGWALHLNNWIPFTQGCFVPSGWNWSSGDENVISLQTDRRKDRRTYRQTTDDRGSEKHTWAFSSGELKQRDFRVYIGGFDENSPFVYTSFFVWRNLKVLCSEKKKEYFKADLLIVQSIIGHKVNRKCRDFTRDLCRRRFNGALHLAPRL